MKSWRPAPSDRLFGVEQPALPGAGDLHGGALDAEELRRLAVGLLLALADVHTARVAHRDVKPGNIIITPAKDVVLVDFGISRETDERGEFPQTEAVGAVLTRQYAAPEQVSGDPVTTATDVYALGVLLYLILTGQHPAGRAVESQVLLLRRYLPRSSSFR